MCGAVVRDAISGKEFSVRAKSVLLCGGPFTDDLRRMHDKTCQEAVRGASGIHIVLPSYYAPKGFGLVDMNTSGVRCSFSLYRVEWVHGLSDGRFLFFLPWQNHVLVGTTDKPCKVSMRPEPDETVHFHLLPFDMDAVEFMPCHAMPCRVGDSVAVE